MKKSVQKQALLAAFLGCTFLFGIKSTSLANASTTVDNFFASMESKTDSLEAKQYYNVGYIKTTYSNTNPGTIYGGTWELIGQGKSLLGMDSGYSVRDTGGEKQVLLTTDTMPSHTHTGTTGTGGNHGHSFVARSGMPNPSNSCHHTFTFMTTETNQGLVSNAGGPMLKEGYASIANGGGHNHTISTNSTGGSLAHNNMQPYVTVYYWEKTANATVTVQNSTGTSQQKLIGLTKRLNAIQEGNAYHKVGDIVSLTTSTDPNGIFGGTWVRTAKGRTLVGVDEKDADFSTVKTYAGEKTHILTSDEMPSHTHNGSTSTRGAHNHAYNKSGANLYGTAFHTNSGNKLYSNNPPDGNSSGLHEQELYTEAGTAGAHGHNFTTDATGSGQGHSNLMPYYTVYMWEKVSEQVLTGGSSYQNYKLLYNDTTFASGNNGIHVYNNDSNGVVTHTRQASQSDNPTGSGYEIKIYHNGGTSSPGLGGFTHYAPSKSGGIFYHIFTAKVPKGYYLHDAANRVGDNSSFSWITSNEGTGEYQTYIYKLTCGTSGTFNDFGYVYLSGSGPVTWYLASSTVLDAT